MHWHSGLQMQWVQFRSLRRRQTERNGFAVDLFAKENDLEISDLKLAKEISAALLAGKKIPICCEKELPEILPEGLYCCEDFAEEPARPGIYIGIKDAGKKEYYR